MPGNETIYKSPRAYLPIVWVDNNLPVNADRNMAAAGFPVGLDAVPAAKAGSLTSIAVLLSEAVTNGTITLTLRLNGVATTTQVTMDDTDGTTKVVDFTPGDVPLAVGDTIGFHLATGIPFQPSAQIDVIVYVETQNI